MIFTPGAPCTVSGYGDLWMERSKRDFIREPCVIVKVCKSGLVMVALASDTRKVTSVAQRNILLSFPAINVDVSQ